MRGFHAYGKARRTSQCAGKARNARALITSHDFTFFQETNLLSRESHYLKTIIPPGYSDYYSNLRKTTAGVATVVSPKINNTYNINQLPLPPSLQGYALLLELAPKSGDAPLYLLNVYFDSASSAARTKQVLDLTRTLPESPRIVLGGDFNFVEDKYRDSSSQSSHYD